MKILCLIDSLGSGGAQRQLCELASLLNNTYEVSILSYWDTHFWDEFLNKNKIGFHTIVNANHPVAKLYKVYKYIKNFSPDVVIAYLDTPGIIACLVKIVLGKRFNLIVSDRNTTQKFNYKEKIRFFLYRRADKIVPNSYTQTRFIKQQYPKLTNKLVTITNFIDTDYFIPGYLDKRNDEATRILIVARVAPQKNVLNFIEVIRILIDNGYKITVNWFGGHAKSELYYQHCMRKIKENNLSDIFYFHEPMVDILHEYQKADVFCLPSCYEGYPNVICEAMSCGLPVLCSGVCDNPMIVENGINGLLFNPDSVKDMVEKMIQYLNLPEKTKYEMGKYSRTIALRKFLKDIFLEKYRSLINYK
jgi:glycosyltransferase involved in cell wall biosynthesis